MKINSASGYLKYSSIYFFYFLAMGVFGSMLSVYLSGVGKSASEISLIVSASGILTMVMQPFIGMIYDRTGEDRRLSVVLMTLSAITGLMFAFTKNTVLLFLLNGLSMAFLNSVNPVCERIAADSPYRYGVVRLWGAIGYAVACQVSGLILDHISPIFNFILFAAAALLTCAGFYAIGAMPIKQAATDTEKGSARSIFTNRSFLFFGLICFLFSGVTGAGSTFVPVLMNRLVSSTSLVGTILFLGTLMEIPIIFLSDRFMDRLTGKQLLIINTALVLVQFVFYSFCENAYILCVVIFLSKSVSTMLFIMVTLKVVMDLSGGNYATTALAIAATSKSLGSVVLTWTCGLIIDAYSLRAAFIFLAILAAITLMCAFLIRLPKGKASYFSAE